MYLNQFNDQMHFLSWKNKVLFNGTNNYLPLLSGSELVTRVIAKDCGGVNISPIITKEVPNDPLSKLFWNGQATCWKCQGMIQRFGGVFFYENYKAPIVFITIPVNLQNLSSLQLSFTGVLYLLTTYCMCMFL